MSTHRTHPQTGFVDARALPKGPNGRALCRRCSIEVPMGRRTFCSESCVHEWRIRSNPGYARDQVRKRDLGICCLCHPDADEIRAKIATDADAEFAREYPTLAVQRDGLIWHRIARKLRGHAVSDGPWEMDHTVPVVEGGGECGLDNLRTLCVACHKRQTAALAGRRAGRTSDPSSQLPFPTRPPNETTDAP